MERWSWYDLGHWFISGKREVKEMSLQPLKYHFITTPFTSPILISTAYSTKGIFPLSLRFGSLPNVCVTNIRFIRVFAKEQWKEYMLVVDRKGWQLRESTYRYTCSYARDSNRYTRRSTHGYRMDNDSSQPVTTQRSHIQEYPGQHRASREPGKTRAL